jgi:hypothetical protein
MMQTGLRLLFAVSKTWLYMIVKFSQAVPNLGFSQDHRAQAEK